MRFDLLTQRWLLLQLCVAVLAFLGLRAGLLQEAWYGDSTYVTSAILTLLVMGWVGVSWRICQCSHYLNTGQYDIWLSRFGESAKVKLSSRVRPYVWLARCLPTLGFFGTVYGMKIAVDGIAGSSLQDAHGASVILQTMVAGFSVALWTTITGLVAYFVLMFNIQTLMGGYERLLTKYLEK